MEREQMREMTTLTRTCPKCGALLAANARYCHACFLQTGLDLLVEGDDASGPDDSPVSAPLSEFGDYELLEELGRGGQGVVYRARQRSLNRTVALKIVGLGQWASTPQLKRFRQEAEAAARLEHPHIVPIYEIGEHDRSCYFSMKFVEGGQLDAALEKQPVGQRDAAELMAKVARTVQFAHEHGILHRDIKPGNILLDNNGQPHLTDFGLARLLERESTITNSRDVLGTPSYIAPEQASGHIKDVTAAVDVYALGAVLYHMLAGQPPFVGATHYETVRMVLEAEPKNPRLLDQTIDRDLATICLKCLEKDASKRYSSAEALAEDLERWLRNEPIKARRSGAITRGRKWLQRNPAVALTISAFAALFVVGALLLSKTYFVPSLTANSIAVLPFEDLSEDKANSYLADGIQDEILTRLSKIADLKVISRTSTQSYKSRPANLREIAQQLGVAHIVEGSVQKNGDTVRVNVQLIKALNDSHVWADTFDRKMNDLFSFETEVAKAIADRLQARLSGEERETIADKPTENVEAHDAYLRGLAYSLRMIYSPANALNAQRYLREAVRLDAQFAPAWALLSFVDARGYLTLNLQPTPALREEARQSAETALRLQPNLGEAIIATGYYYYGCLNDYDTAERYYEQARESLPNSSRIPESLAYVARRRGQWDKSEAYFNEAERLDPRNVYLLTQHAQSYILLRRFAEAVRKLDQVLNITPDDPDANAIMAGIAQAQGDLPRAAALLAPLRLSPNDPSAFETQVYQAILERQPAPVIDILKQTLAKPDPSLGYYNGELRWWLAWAQDVAGDKLAAQQSWQQARNELQVYLDEQPDNRGVIEDLALTNVFLGNKAEAFALAERAMKLSPIEKDAMRGPRELELMARVAVLSGEPDRAIEALQRLLSLPYAGVIVEGVPLTPALLRLDPMFDPLRQDARFQKLAGL
jgi:serine/threonine protein kinase/Flp pilus assembly protein TadD